MTGDADLTPLFAALAPSARAPRPLGELLPLQTTEPATSPWSPKIEIAAAPIASAPAIDQDAILRVAIAAAERDAAERGRADGLRETDAARATLRALADELQKLRDMHIDRVAEAIADAAVVVIDAWIGASDRRALFQPIVREWLAAAGETAAVARVCPADEDAIRAAIGDAAIRVEPDPKLAPGDLELRGPAFDTTQIWRDRLPELRDAIALALEESAR